MKSQYHLLLIVLFFLTLPFKSIGQNVQDQLAGTWIFDYEESLRLMDGKAKKHFDAMDSSRKDKVERAYVNRKIVLTGNGGFVQEFNDGRKLEAVWALVSEGGKDKIKVSDSRGVRWFNIKKLKGDALIISPEHNGGKKANMLMSQWFLTRVTD